MKKLLCIAILLVAKAGFAQNPNYDSTLVKKLGADDYGMKLYVFVILISGENTTATKEFKDSCYAGHMENINRLVDEKLLIVAGPFISNEDQLRGLFILDVATLEEAENILATDPAIKTDLLRPILYLWYGSAALPEYLDSADKIWKIQP